MATYGSRMSFRSRKVDNKKLLLILRDSDAPDIDSIASQRSSVQIETGVEKEEEEEHHLQIAILASQAAYTGGNVTSKYIPTPDASKIIEDYNSLYPADFKQPSNLISYDDIYEDSIGTAYCLDEIDQEILRSVSDPALKKLREARFEEIMSLLEEAAGDGRIKHCIGIVGGINLPESLLCQRLRIDRSSKAGSDPFLCFKRREMKLQRRTRATDSFYISKLNKLREDMKTCQEIIAVTLKREETLEELIKVQDQVFKLRSSIHKKRAAAQYATPYIVPPSKKQKIVEDVASSVSVTQKPKPRPKPRRPASGRRKSEEAGWLDITDLPYQFPSIPSSQRYFCYPPSLVPNASHQDVCFRRRKGRGGRILVDRCHFSFQQKQEDVGYHVNSGWVQDNFPASDEFNAISLRYASQLLTEQDQAKLQPSLFPGSLHHSDNPPLPHGLLEGKLAAALTARMNCSADIVSETEVSHNPPLDAPVNTDIHVPSDH